MTLILRFHIQPPVVRAMRIEEVSAQLRRLAIVPFWVEWDCSGLAEYRLTCHWRAAEFLAQHLRSLIDATDDVDTRESFMRLLTRVETELARQPVESFDDEDCFAAGDPEDE